jgi:hypothetical protein
MSKTEEAQHRLHEAAYHEASHAVVHFAVENPHSPTLNITSNRAYYYQQFSTGMARAWVDLAGTIGGAVYNLDQIVPGAGFDEAEVAYRLRLYECDDHSDAAFRLIPDYQPGSSVTRGRIAKVLRNEARLVSDLLRQNWPVVERVAQAAIRMGMLFEAALRQLIEGPGDLVRVWESSVAKEYRELGLERRRRRLEGQKAIFRSPNSGQPLGQSS